MLHAFNQKNVRRVLSLKGDEHLNNRNEDAVTSMVFGPLVFMATAEAVRALGAIVGPLFENALQGRAVLGARVSLWPPGLRARDRTSGEVDTRCEPDLLALLDLAGGARLAVIGEMKWDWRLTDALPAREIFRERQAVGAAHPKAEILVFAVTKFKLEKAPPKTVARTWVDVQGAASALRRAAPHAAAGLWGGAVATFLDKAIQTAFQGFQISDPGALPCSTPVFWKTAPCQPAPSSPPSPGRNRSGTRSTALSPRSRRPSRRTA